MILCYNLYGISEVKLAEYLYEIIDDIPDKNAERIYQIISCVLSPFSVEPLAKKLERRKLTDVPIYTVETDVSGRIFTLPSLSKYINLFGDKLLLKKYLEIASLAFDSSNNFEEIANFLGTFTFCTCNLTT